MEIKDRYNVIYASLYNNQYKEMSELLLKIGL